MIVIVMSATLALALGIAWRAFVVVPNDLRVETQRIAVPSFHSDQRFRLLHLTDLHLWQFGDLHRDLLSRAKKLQPDAIALTGDYAESAAGLEALATLLQALRSIAPLYAVLGDNDQEEAVWQVGLEELFAQNDVILLRNAAHLIEHQNQVILIAGVDDPNSGYSSLDQAREDAQASLLSGGYDLKLSDIPALLLAHSPEIVHEIQPWLDLVLTGHTHGGQICLPGGRALYTNTPRCKGYASGLYRVAPATALYVNRGVGTARIPARLFCPPEMAVFDLEGTPRAEAD